MAACQAAKEAVWLRMFLKELGVGDFYKPTIIWTDSQASLDLMKNPVYHARTKHIRIQYHFVRELVEEEQVSFLYLSTNSMAADALTKSVPRAQLEMCYSGMGLKPVV